MACFPQVSRAVLAVSAVMAAVLSHSAQAQTVVRIGHVGPVSGPQARSGAGRAARRATQAACSALLR